MGARRNFCRGWQAQKLPHKDKKMTPMAHRENLAQINFRGGVRAPTLAPPADAHGYSQNLSMRGGATI